MVSKIILKAALLSTCIFWLILTATENFHLVYLGIIILSVIPITLCCAITIIVTILPFFKFNKNSNRIIFKKYFPFYAIVCFSLCFYGLLNNSDLTSFFASAFFTTMQSWVWFGKEAESKS